MSTPEPGTVQVPGLWRVSWYAAHTGFEYHGPWWITGRELSGGRRHTIVAAVVADSADAARKVITDVHDAPVPELEWRFVDERPAGWDPFTDRFPRADWMRWPYPEATS